MILSSDFDPSLFACVSAVRGEDNVDSEAHEHTSVLALLRILSHNKNCWESLGASCCSGMQRMLGLKSVGQGSVLAASSSPDRLGTFSHKAPADVSSRMRRLSTNILGKSARFRPSTKHADAASDAHSDGLEESSARRTMARVRLSKAAPPPLLPSSHAGGSSSWSMSASGQLDADGSTKAFGV